MTDVYVKARDIEVGIRILASGILAMEAGIGTLSTDCLAMETGIGNGILGLCTRAIDSLILILFTGLFAGASLLAPKPVAWSPWKSGIFFC